MITDSELNTSVVSVLPQGGPKLPLCSISATTSVIYCKISNIRRTKSQNLYVSGLVLQLSLANQLKSGVKSRMKMQLEERQLHLSDQQTRIQQHLRDKKFHCLLRTWIPIDGSCHLADDNDQVARTAKRRPTNTGPNRGVTCNSQDRHNL